MPTKEKSKTSKFLNILKFLQIPPLKMQGWNNDQPLKNAGRGMCV